MGLYQYDSTEDKLNLVAGSTNFSDAPVGAIFPFGGTDIPISFLLCDGSAVSRTDYEDLFNVIGTAFGTGDGSTTFNLPDLREAVPKGAGLTGKTVGAHLDADGLAVGEFLDDQIQEHTHTVRNASGSSEYGATLNGQVTVLYSNGQSGGINSGRKGATTEVKSVGVNYIIKAKMVALPADLASGVEELINTENILWENQNPNSAFSAQDATLANDNYRYLTIYYKEYAERNYYLSVKFPKGVGCFLNKIDVSSVDYYVYNRICSYTNSTKLHFDNAYQSSQATANNMHIIPIKIVGSMT